MKYKAKAPSCASYVSGIAVISCAAMTAILLIMSAAGLIFPRKTEIVLATESISKIYDEKPISETDINVKYGKLHENHQLFIINKEEFSSVGEYINSPKYKIVDSTGDDVTKMYTVTEDFGTIKISGKEIVVFSSDKTKQYDASPLESSPISIINGELCNGHSFVSGTITSITLPGVTEILPNYKVINREGHDVTHEYAVDERLGVLTVEARTLSFSTGSADKFYDGKPISNSKWELLHGSLLEGHKVHAKCITEVSDVGEHENKADVWVEDSGGADVSNLYNITFEHGILSIKPMVLYIETGSASKEYDGEPIENMEWKLISGSIGDGERIVAVSGTKLTNVSSVKNEIQFQITDSQGNDITNRYSFVQSGGKIQVTPRAVTLRTASASKQYDGEPLSDSRFEVIKGSLCKGESIKLATTSIVNVGYTQNYIIEYTVYGKNADGSITDVSSNYRISYDYGTLTITN